MNVEIIQIWLTLCRKETFYPHLIHRQYFVPIFSKWIDIEDRVRNTEIIYTQYTHKLGLRVVERVALIRFLMCHY